MNARKIHLIIKTTLLFLTLSLLIGCKGSPKVLWRYKTDAPLNHSPAFSGNKLIVGGEDSHLYAFDPNNGSVLWKTFLGERVLVTPLVEGNTIFTGTAAGDFFAIDAEQGKIKWKFHAEKMLEFEPCADPEGIYVGSYDGKLYKLSRDGRLIWAFSTPLYINSTCAIYKDLVITSSWDYNVYGIRRDNGTQVWKFDTGEYAYGGPIVAGDRGYYLSHSQFYGFYPDTGKFFYRDKINYSNNVLAYRNHLYTPEHGLSKRQMDGKVLKRLIFKSFSQFTPAVAGAYVVTSDTSNYLIGVSPETLEIKWKLKGKDLFWCPGVEHQGNYYIGNSDGTLYAIKLP